MLSLTNAFPLVFGRNRRQYRLMRSILVVILLAYALDMLMLSCSNRIDSSGTQLDVPFAMNCSVHEPDTLLEDLLDKTEDESSTYQRENATIMILARNSDLTGVLSAMQSLESRWNHRYRYPYVFLNDKQWDQSFIDSVRHATSSDLVFETIAPEMWSWPKNTDGTDAVNKTEAKDNWEAMRKAGLPYVTQESYHHMCRFFSGFFFDHPAMAKYRYYWRVEPDVSFSCRIPYDPFKAMRVNDKIYGYTMALWEVGSTCPSLFRTTANFKEDNKIPTTSLWSGLLTSNWAPLPIRWYVMSIPSFLHSRTRYGEGWNHCHFWSNFEIADMEFFRSAAYRAYFSTLDKAGGFYTERWGDAPVHSLALAMFAKPEQLHYFEDIGYSHPPFQHCPPEWIGCDCACNPDGERVSNYCLDKLRQGVM